MLTAGTAGNGGLNSSSHLHLELPVLKMILGVGSIGVLFRVAWFEIDGTDLDRFTSIVPGPSCVSPKGHLWLEAFQATIQRVRVMPLWTQTPSALFFFKKLFWIGKPV